MPITPHGRATSFREISVPPANSNVAGRGAHSATPDIRRQGRHRLDAKVRIGQSVLRDLLDDLLRDAAFQDRSGDRERAEALRADAEKLSAALDVLGKL